MSFAPLARHRPSSPRQRKRVALVGLGYWGPNLLRNLVSGLGVDGVVAVDARADRLESARAAHPGLALESRLERALDRHVVDAVVIATQVSTHHALACTAIAAGCQVLVEKPLAASSIEAEDLVDRASAAGVILMVGHTFLFSPRVELMQRCVAEGLLGEIQYVTSARMNLGLHQSDVSVVWDLAPHDFSILFRVLGEFPERVRASGRSMLDGDRAEVAFLELDFPSGVIASVSVSWLAPSKSRRTVIVGDRQMLVYEDLDAEQPVRLYDRGVVLPEPQNFGEHQLTYRHGDIQAPHVPAVEPLAREVEHFLACVGGTETCRSDGEFGLRVVKALEAAEQSMARRGEPVDVQVDRAVDPRDLWRSNGRTGRIGTPLNVPAPAAGD
jgi:predicted dehydrogenase